MRLLSLHVERFCRFREPFDLPLANQGLVLIDGPNRAGKSTLFEPIPWILWGKMVRYGDKRIGATEVGADADATLYFEGASGQVFKARRTRQGAGVKVTVHVGDRFGGEWEPLTGSPVVATGDLTPLIGFDYDAFRYALFLQAAGLTFATDGFAAQIRLLESILRFDLLTEAGEIAKTRHKEQASLFTLVSTRLHQARESAVSWQQVISEQESLDESGQMLEVAREIRHFTVTISKLEKARVDRQRLADEYRQSQTDWANAQAELKVMQGQYRKWETLPGTCPTCEREVPALTVASAMEKLRIGIEDQAALVERYREVENGVRRRLDSLDYKDGQLEAARSTLRAKQDALAAMTERQVKHDAIVAQNKARLVQAEENIGRLTEEAGAAEHLSLLAEFWTKGFTRLKEETLATATPILNEAALRYSDLLIGEDYQVIFNTLRANRSENMIQLSGPWANDYFGLSSSEKRCVGLTAALSLRALARWRLAQPINLALYDEVFDTLDEQGLQNVIAVIERDMQELETTFVVTHNPSLKALFPGARVIRVSKVGGKSRVHL